MEWLKGNCIFIEIDKLLFIEEDIRVLDLLLEAIDNKNNSF